MTFGAKRVSRQCFRTRGVFALLTSYAEARSRAWPRSARAVRWRLRRSDAGQRDDDAHHDPLQVCGCPPRRPVADRSNRRRPDDLAGASRRPGDGAARAPDRLDRRPRRHAPDRARRHQSDHSPDRQRRRDHGRGRGARHRRAAASPRIRRNLCPGPHFQRPAGNACGKTEAGIATGSHGAPRRADRPSQSHPLSAEPRARTDASETWRRTCRALSRS